MTIIIVLIALIPVFILLGLLDNKHCKKNKIEIECREENDNAIMRRISDLENPYKYEIGHKVKKKINRYCSMSGYKEINFNGFINSRSCSYSFGRRYNNYSVYNPKTKEEKTIYESEL